MRGAALLALLLAAAAPAAAETVRVDAIVDGDTLTLDDGRALRLAGIEAAKPPPDAPDGRRWPLAEAAKALLEKTARGRTVDLPTPSPAPDRHGRIAAHAVAEGGAWLQGALLSAGLARVRTAPHDRDRAAEMLALEHAAREAKHGMWATRVYAVRPAEPAALKRDAGSFQIVEGRVARAEKRSGSVYLDFGDDWRRDVTARIDSGPLRLFAKANFDPLTLAGARVRVRGWVDEHYGPLILITHPEQVERVEGDEKSKR